MNTTHRSELIVKLKTTSFFIECPKQSVKALEQIRLETSNVSKIVSLYGNLKTLDDFIEHVPIFRQYCGLCSNFFGDFDWNERRILASVISLWPDYSGRTCYPIRSYIDGLCAIDAYETMRARGLMYEGEYGKKRIELFNFVMDAFKILLRCE